MGLLIVKRPLERRSYAHHVRNTVTIGRGVGNILLATDDLVSEYHTSIVWVTLLRGTDLLDC